MFKKKGANKKRGQKRRIMRKPKPSLGLNPAVHNIQKAVMSETWERGTLAPNSAYFNQFSIGLFPRAMAMARLFKFYRAKRIIWEYRPDQTTFQAGAGQVSIPYAYYVMNRDGATSTGQTVANYLNLGSRPIKFTQKILVSYKPNTVQISDLISTPQAGANITVGRQPVFDKWYSTDGLGQTASISSVQPMNSPLLQPAFNVSAVQYFGHDIYFDQGGANPESTIGDVSVTVEWEFKVPAYTLPTPS